MNTWFLILCTGIMITGAQWCLLLLITNQYIFRIVITCLFVITSVVVYFIASFHVYIDRSMIDNIISTNYLEAIEFAQWRIIPYLLIIGLMPSFIIWKCVIFSRTWLSSLKWRISSLFLAVCMVIGSVWFGFHEIGPTFREKRDLVWLITPSNYLLASTDFIIRRNKTVPDQKIKVGEDAQLIARAPDSKPRLILLVVGETVRASNWGLNGYRRLTTPNLAKHKVFNFNQVNSCGTTTAISVPCMFSPYGLHAFNQSKIVNSESLLHVLNRAKVSILWRDNQSGCKGVCNHLPYEQLNVISSCRKRRCFDEILLHNLKEKIKNTNGDQLIVLHMLGNHGPGYFERYPKQFKRWLPTCDTTDLASCTKEAIINTYDNAILYTDNVLNGAIKKLLDERSYDTGLIYLSDHGESLGEHNIFLHGLPYLIAPNEQKRVPLILWLSNGLMNQLNLQERCLRNKESKSISQDYLFSTVLALFGVKTEVYDSEYDLTYTCRIRANSSNN